MKTRCVVWLVVLAIASTSDPAFADQAAAPQAEVPRNTKPFTRFKVVLDGILNDTLPFDVPIIIWGDVRGAAESISLDIAEAGSGNVCSAGIFEPKGHAKLKTWTTAEYQDRSVAVPTDLSTDPRQQFEFIVGPFDHSKLYCFRFSPHPGQALTGPQAAAILPRLRTAYLQFFQQRPKIESADQAAAEALRQDLIRSLLSVPFGDQRLEAKPGTVFDRATPAAAARSQFLEGVRKVIVPHNAVVDTVHELQMPIPRASLDEALRGAKLAVAAIAKPGIAATDATKARAVLDGLDRDQMASLLRGLPRTLNAEPVSQANLQPVPGFPDKDKNDYTEADACPATGVLRSRCTEIDKTLAVVNAVMAVDGRAEIVTLSETFADAKILLLQLQRNVNRRHEQIDDHLEALELLALENIFSIVTTMGNLQTRKSWHVSSGSGIAVAPAIGEVFPYTGAHFYFRPVNREAPLRGVGRRTSMLVGFTWTTNLKQAGERDALFGADAMLVLGVSVRLNEALAFTGGGLVFKQHNANPLIQRTSLGVTPFLALAFDLDIAGLVGGLFGADSVTKVLGSGAPGR